MNKFYNAQNAGHGGDFRCEECLKMFYITKNDIKHRYKCLCDECWNKSPKKNKQKYEQHKILRKKPYKQYKLHKIKPVKIYKSRKKKLKSKIKHIKYNRVKPKKKQNRRDKYSTIIKQKRKQRLEIYDRCEKCGFKPIHSKHLHIHHKDKNVANNADKNLILLCVQCHIKEHKDLKGITSLLKKQEQEMLNS